MSQLWPMEEAGKKGMSVTNPGLKKLPLALVGPCSATMRTSLLVIKKDTAQTPPLLQLTASSIRFTNEPIVNQLL